MYHMIIFVVDDVDLCPDILDAWESLGVGGVTILESTGLGRVRDSGIRDDIPLMPSLSNLMRTREERHRTLFTVVEGEEMVDLVIGTTVGITGSLDEPNKGILFVLPVSRILGTTGSPPKKGEESSGDE